MSGKTEEVDIYFSIYLQKTKEKEINNKNLNNRWEKCAPNQTLVHCEEKTGMHIDSQEFFTGFP